MIRNNKGFTLVELMVVIVIIGILAALAIPKFTTASDKAKWSEGPTVLASYENAQLARMSETGALGAVDELVFEAPTGSKWFTYDEANAGDYHCAVTGAAIGGVATGTGIQTTVAADGTITHAVYNNADEDAVRRMCGNFLPAN